MIGFGDIGPNIINPVTITKMTSISSILLQNQPQFATYKTQMQYLSDPNNLMYL